MDETITWIACADRMPPKNEPVLIAPFGDPPVYIGVLGGSPLEWELDDGNDYLPLEKITHWAELPSGPSRVGEQS